MKKNITIFLLLITILTIFESPSIANASSVKKLSVMDFKYSGDYKDQLDGNIMKYLDENNPDETGWSVAWYYVKDEDKSQGGVIKTNRGITLSSTKADVFKAYGEKKLSKVNIKTDKFYTRHEKAQDLFDNSTKYVQYTYKNDNNEYVIRFYFNKKNKINVIVYFKNYDNLTTD